MDHFESFSHYNDFYPGGPGSNPIRDVGFFQAMHHFLVTNFHIRKMGARLSHLVIKMTFS